MKLTFQLIPANHKVTKTYSSNPCVITAFGGADEGQVVCSMQDVETGRSFEAPVPIANLCDFPKTTFEISAVKPLR